MGEFIMSRKVCFSTHLLLILLLGSIGTFASADVENTSTFLSEQASEFSPREKEIFLLLEKAFPGEILDDGFKTLRKLSEHPAYLEFLSETYPIGKPFKKFEQFTQNVLPTKERYRVFFLEYLNLKTVDEITDADLAIYHKMSDKMWQLDVEQRQGKEINEASMISFLTETLMTKDVQDWMVQREIITQGNTGPQIGQFFLNLILSNLQVVKDDTEMVKAFVEGHGQDTGLVALAVQKPILFGRIISNFTDTEVFQEWMEGRRDQ